MSFRLIRRVFYFLILLVLLAAAGLTWWTGREIASPTRRPLQDYHLEFLADPAAHGVVVEKYTLKDGTPCLMCVPESSGKLGVRGVTVRKQLEERGLLLAPAGKVIGTLVLVHGRKGRKEDYLLIAERLCAAGFRCLLADMPAHGDHPSGLAYYGVREADLPARLVIDCSHGNSSKDHRRQPAVFADCLEQRARGEKSLIGVMIESNLKEGSQPIPRDLKRLEHGVSVTDKCLGWEATEKMILSAYRADSSRES